MALEATIRAEEARERHEQPIYFARFFDYPYDDWKPVRQRYEFINKNAVGTSSLDVACGYYPVTSELHMTRKVGIDVSQRAKAKAWKELDEFYCLDVTQASAEFLKGNIGTFDTIVASEFLEHLPRPYETIEKIACLLNPGGRILITVPSGRSIAGLVDKTRSYLRGRGFTYDRFRLFHRTHTSCLRIKEWEDLFKKAGLRIAMLDWRPSDIVEGFPKETAPGWKLITRIAPDYLAHQYFFVLEKTDTGAFSGATKDPARAAAASA